MKIAVLGVTGMLGSQVLRTLEKSQKHHIIASCRDRKAAAPLIGGSTQIVELDAQTVRSGDLIDLLGDCDWWINCIGMIKPYIHDDNPLEVAEAIAVNSFFPAVLAQAADESKTRLIQIATDCVWDGEDGNYSENAHHNATDVYGKSKSLGEVRSQYSHFIRCSVIGREYQNRVSLLDWFLSQAQGATLKGFQNHHWNGVTTLQFARICRGAIEQGLPLKFMQHLVPADQVSKYELLKYFTEHFNRPDIEIEPFSTRIAIDRTLSTVDSENNLNLWKAGGYAGPPTIESSVAELARATIP